MSAPNTTAGAYERWAATLANLYAETQEATKPKASAIATAKLGGFVAAAHIGLTALGANVGAAPFAVEMDVITAWNINGSERPAFTSYSIERKAWHDKMVATLIARWSA